MQQREITVKKLYLSILNNQNEFVNGTKVHLEGWVKTNRDNGAVGFIELNDGTYFKNVQLVYDAKVVKDYIKNYCDEEYQEYIFLGKKGARLDRSAVYRVLNRCMQELGIDIKCGTHSCRKYCGRAIFEQTKDLSIVMTIFNHSSQRISARYIGLTEDRIKDTYLNLDLGLAV